MGISTEYRITLSTSEDDSIPVKIVEHSLEDAQNSYNLLKSVAFQSDETVTVTQLTTRVEESDITEYMEQNKSDYVVDTIIAD